jgi:hypothetical protein
MNFTFIGLGGGAGSPRRGPAKPARSDGAASAASPGSGGSGPGALPDPVKVIFIAASGKWEARQGANQ